MTRLTMLFATLTIAFSLAAQTPEQLPNLSLSVTAYPDHALPGIPPSLQVIIANNGGTPITLPTVHLCLHGARPDGTTFSVGCSVGGMSVDDPNNHLQFAGTPQTQVQILSKATYTAYLPAPDDSFFFDSSLMQPGTYQLRFLLNGGDAASNTLQYVVDTPAGENLLIWSVITSRPADRPQPYVDDQLTPLFIAHPNSDYAKASYLYRDMIHHGSLTDFAQRLQGYLANTPPQSFDGIYRTQLAETYLAMAEDAVRRAAAVTDTAVQFAAQGRAILQSLASSTDAYASWLATTSLSTEPWTRELLQRWLDSAKPKRYIPIIPHADCVMLNSDGSYTAWFGYTNKNTGIYGAPIGPQNTFSSDPADRGQPTSLGIGEHQSAFSIHMTRGEQATWVLFGKPAVANAAGDRQNCDTPLTGAAKKE